MRQGIVDTVERALSVPKVKSVVICGQNGVFCGGMFFLFPVTSQWQHNPKSVVVIVTFNCKPSLFDRDKIFEKAQLTAIKFKLIIFQLIISQTI